jgi:hypothetical protein
MVWTMKTDFETLHRWRLATDRRNCTMHEGSHFVIARHAGLKSINAWIAQINDGHDIGLISFTGQVGIDKQQHVKLSGIRRSMIGVAGAIGEAMWRNRFDGWEVDPVDILSGDQMSATDWEMCDCTSETWGGKQIQAADRVIDLLCGDLHQEWLQTARLLMIEEELYTDWQAKIYGRLARIQKLQSLTNVA